jgi:hypothetical protein
MAEFADLLLQLGGSVSTFLLALSGVLFVLYVGSIAGIVAWQKVRGR